MMRVSYRPRAFDGAVHARRVGLRHPDVSGTADRAKPRAKLERVGAIQPQSDSHSSFWCRRRGGSRSPQAVERGLHTIEGFEHRHVSA